MNGSKVQEEKQVAEDELKGKSEMGSKKGVEGGKATLVPLEEEKIVKEEERVKELIVRVGNAGKKPSKRLSELALKISKSPDLFANSRLREERELIKFISKTPFTSLFQNADRKRKEPGQFKVYKNFFVSLFESVLIMKKIEPLSEAELEIRTLSIPKPISLLCTFEY
jgi:hypothetical protein